MQSVDVRILGIVEYTDALDMMSTLQQQRIDDEIPDTILFLEHPEIVTVGPRARNDGIAPPPDYRSHPVDRGGEYFQFSTVVRIDGSNTVWKNHAFLSKG